MAYYVVKKINELIEPLLKEFLVIAPLKNEKILSFEKVSSEDKLFLTSRNTDMSPKEVFFPNTETLFLYKDGKIEKESASGEKKVLFGVRACDVKGFTILDKVFLTGCFEDPYYKERRKNTLIFGTSCNAPLSTCFCTSFHIGPFYKENTDVFMVELDEKWLLESITDEGESLINKLGIQAASLEDIEKMELLKKNAEASILNTLDIDRLGELTKRFNDPLWDEFHIKCLGCGVCSFICPTCHCFDILDEGNENEGKRIRIWDSCQFPLFTLHASGHQPRPTQLERFRQRIMHKFSYFLERFGEVACVGCGRCIIKCPVNIDIRDVLRRLSL